MKKFDNWEACSVAADNSYILGGLNNIRNVLQDLSEYFISSNMYSNDERDEIRAKLQKHADEYFTYWNKFMYENYQEEKLQLKRMVVDEKGEYLGYKEVDSISEDLGDTDEIK